MGGIGDICHTDVYKFKYHSFHQRKNMFFKIIVNIHYCISFRDTT